MVSTRLRALKAATAPLPNALSPVEATPPPPPATREGRDGGTLEYERCRDERIRENMERMQKLGILDLSHTFKSSVASQLSASKRPYRRRTTPSTSPLAVDLPPRRSTRLQNVTPVSYVELRVRRKDEDPRNAEISLVEGPKEEVYTDEHEKLLGTCETTWTLFVDGYNTDGVRIYDPVKGKTCHQCRQKTLGHRTHCSRCNIVQGQFCGDCLYMRYGENVLEANENPDWICPVCRGICNCSICRSKRGWAPTGTLYKKVSSLGYKSVAHYLIQTRRGLTNVEDIVPAKPTSAKRSLPFTDEDRPSENFDSNNDNGHCNGQIIILDSDKSFQLRDKKDAECGGDGECRTRKQT
uniref:Cell division cycle-associated 7-like protein n=1 Tax=Anthurium amnicola TaxID=1678845 RepID=A0A1D1ZKM7_9ARAE